MDTYPNNFVVSNQFPQTADQKGSKHSTQDEDKNDDDNDDMF